MTKLFLDWDQTEYPIQWDDNPYFWEDVAVEIVEAVSGGADPTGAYDALEDKKKKRVIELICRIKGKEYKEVKKVSEVKVTANDIKLMVKEVLDIDLDVIIKERDGN